jgi:transposase
MAQYSQDLQDRAVELVHSGASFTEADKIFGVSIRTIQSWYGRFHYRKHPGAKPRVTKDEIDAFFNANRKIRPHLARQGGCSAP